MDIVSHYSPPSVQASPVHVSSWRGQEHDRRRHSLPATGVEAGPQSNATNNFLSASPHDRNGKEDVRSSHASKTFDKSVKISLQEPIGSMSLSPANRDVVLAARKGLFIVDLENLYDQPRFLPHLTTWVPADVQWNPHPARANWVASTSNNKLLVWDLNRPNAPRIEPMFPASTASASGTSPSMASLAGKALISPSTHNSTLPRPVNGVGSQVDLLGSTSRLSSISHALHAHTRAITDINWSPFHPEVLASCGIDSWTWAWDLRDPNRPKQGYSAWNAAMTQVKWNRATQHRLATSCDNKVLIWDDRKGALPLATIEAHENRIYGVDWSRDTSLGLSRLVTCSLDGSVKWWDLDSPAAQNAIGQRQLVTEPETTIDTPTPVWRARHLPFGHGVMTLPQRGDTSLSMWSKSEPEKPVHRFEGHSDIVKEYLFRTRGGDDREHDDRQFQLITWSKDQTLRLWPITKDMMSSVGHRSGQPIRVLQTRRGAPDVSYRAPPAADSSSNVTPAGLQIHSNSSSSNVSVALGTSVGMGVPHNTTRSLLSGSNKGSVSTYNSLQVSSPVAAAYSQGSQPKVGSVGHSEGALRVQRPLRKATSATQMAVRQGHRNKIEESQSTLTHIRTSGSSSMNLGRRRMDSVSRRHGFSAASGDSTTDVKTYMSSHRKNRARQTSHGRIMSQKAASRNFMTRGTVGQGGQGRIGAAQKGNASRLDAVGWIAGVRVGDEAGPEKSTEATPRGRGQPNAPADMHDEPDQRKDSAQVLSEEIMAVSKSLSDATFEKIDVSSRSCTATCYGPWAGRGVPCFVRINFIFPPTYPGKPPKFELEHNASVPLNTRAFLLRNISAILNEHARSSTPSMEACLNFLLGGTMEKESNEVDTSMFPNWFGVDEEQEDEEAEAEDGKLADMRIPARICGATFARNGEFSLFTSQRRTLIVH